MTCHWAEHSPLFPTRARTHTADIQTKKEKRVRDFVFVMFDCVCLVFILKTATVNCQKRDNLMVCHANVQPPGYKFVFPPVASVGYFFPPKAFFSHVV